MNWALACKPRTVCFDHHTVSISPTLLSLLLIYTSPSCLMRLLKSLLFIYDGRSFINWCHYAVPHILFSIIVIKSPISPWTRTTHSVTHVKDAILFTEWICVRFWIECFTFETQGQWPPQTVPRSWLGTGFVNVGSGSIYENKEMFKVKIPSGFQCSQFFCFLCVCVCFCFGLVCFRGSLS